MRTARTLAAPADKQTRANSAPPNLAFPGLLFPHRAARTLAASVDEDNPALNQWMGLYLGEHPIPKVRLRVAGDWVPLTGDWLFCEILYRTKLFCEPNVRAQSEEILGELKQLRYNPNKIYWEPLI